MDPNILTAEKLKRELIERHVTLPKNPRKEVLVELYRVHVPAGKAAGHRLEFSDDDERVVNAKSRKVRNLSTISDCLIFTCIICSRLILTLVFGRL